VNQGEEAEKQEERGLGGFSYERKGNGEGEPGAEFLGYRCLSI
jgi:hypothetical protein